MENIMTKLQEILPEILLVEKVEINDSFSSFDSWDSITILMITEFCATEYGISLSVEQIENSQTIKELKELIESKLKVTR